MEINFSQVHSLNLVTIDGVSIENVTNYSIRSGRDGETEVTLSFKLPNTNIIECSVVGSR